MKKIFVFAIAAMLLVGPFTAGGDQAPAKQLQFNFRICEGDPLGSREAGTLKLLAEPRLMAMEKQSFSFRLGGEVPVFDGSTVQFAEFGRKIEAKAASLKDGKVFLTITLSNTTVGEEKKEAARRLDGIQLHTESTQTFTVIELGQVKKLKWPKADADKQVWAELSIEEVRP